MESTIDQSQTKAEMTASPGEPVTAVDPEQWVETHGDALFRYAWMRVRSQHTAEDLVQETFLAAWRARDRFSGRASEKGWLMGILKHKIADHFRQPENRESGADLDTLAEFEDSQFEAGALGGRHWSRSGAPKGWSHPSADLERTEFWSVLRECAAELPPKVADVFLRREAEEMATDQICADLKITSSHLFVLLHRARLALRRCLELNWFKNKPGRERRKTT